MINTESIVSFRNKMCKKYLLNADIVFSKDLPDLVIREALSDNEMKNNPYS
jgi:hypothetical protein